mmetsp:Transcript_74009/g.163449  ORF Transcript_74009/g.163449 Transcript_74009/m.163449 type:complete len:174 (+) Transcript_74009:60-581(+)
MVNNQKPVSLWALKFLSYLSLIIAIMNSVQYILGSSASLKNMINNSDTIDVFWYLFLVNVYGAGFSIVVALIELRNKPLFKQFKGFKNWAIRGLFVIFVALLNLTLNTTASVGLFNDNDKNEKLQKSREILAYILFGIGVFYLLGEILCCRRRMQGIKSKYVSDSTLAASSLV